MNSNFREKNPFEIDVPQFVCGQPVHGVVECDAVSLGPGRVQDRGGHHGGDSVARAGGVGKLGGLEEGVTALIEIFLNKKIHCCVF